MDNEPHNVWAIVAAAVVTGAAALWKVWFAVRKDARTDAASGEIQGGYSVAFKNLRDEVARLSASVAELSKALDTERAARYAAESRALTAEWRAANAEGEVADLKAKVALLELDIKKLRPASK